MPEPTEAKREISQWLGPLVVSIRSRAIPIHETWLRNYAAWRGRHTRRQFQSETFSHTLPASRRAVERSVTRITQMLMPSSQFFEVYPGAELDEDAGRRAEAVWAYEFYVLSKKISTRRILKQWVRCMQLYGRAVSKTTVRVETIGGVGPDGSPTETKHVWPNCRAVDPFMFYVWPETATTVEDGVVTFEDNMMPWETYKSHVASKVADPIEQRDLTAPEWPTTLVRRLAASQLTDPSATAQGATKEQDQVKSLVNFVALTEVWFKSNGRLRCVWLVWNVADSPRVVRDYISKFPASPYRMALARELPGEQYTSGMMDDLEPLQAFLNDELNITLETQATAVWPPAAVDPNLIRRGDTLRYRPRQKWLIEPNAVKWMEPPDLMRLGFQGVQMGMAFIDSFAGSNPLAEGTPTRNMPRAGFAVSSLLNLSLADLKDIGETIEDELLTPLLADIYRLTMMFVPAQQMVAIPGARDMAAKRVRMEELVGDWEFRWVGSMQSQDFQVRATRLITLLGQLAKAGPVIQQDLMNRGKRINWTSLLQRLWRDGVGERGADSLIEDIPPQEMLQNMMQALLRLQTGQNLAEQGKVSVSAGVDANSSPPGLTPGGGGG